MIKVGIVGLGFMGKMHFRCYKANKNVKLVAICDIDEKKFADTGGTAGNISGADKPLGFKGVSLYTNFDKMLKEAELDAVSITLPTYLHCQYTLKALKAGVHTFCEKPMAMNVGECQKMIDAFLYFFSYCLSSYLRPVKFRELVHLCFQFRRYCQCYAYHVHHLYVYYV